MFNHLCLQGKCTYVTFIYHVFNFMPTCGRYIWEFSKSALISVQNSGYSLKFVGYNQNFDFHPACQSNLFLVTWFVLANCEILPLAPFCAAIYG